MKDIKVFFDITTNAKYASAYRGYQTVRVNSNETFDELKLRLLTDYASNKAFFVLAYKYALGIHFLSFSRLPKQPIFPQGKNSVLNILENVNSGWEGVVCLVLSDMFTRSKSAYHVPASIQTSYASSSNASSGVEAYSDYSPYDEIVPLSNLQFSTEWLIHNDDTCLLGTTVLQCLNDIVENVGSKCGILQKFQVSRDIWREEYIVLDENRLYFHPINDQAGVGAYSCVELKPSMRVFTEDGNNVITITQLSRNTMRKQSGSSTLDRKSEFVVKLRAKSEEEAVEWFRAIQSRSEITPQKLVGNDNDDIFLAEKLIENTEKLFFEDDLNTISHLSTFEGMLCNRYLRENFRSFLSSQYSDEFLKFWEYSEDYRRGHPLSPQPFKFKGNADSNETVEIDDQYVKKWATSIFDAFLKDGAAHQISDCSSDDRTKIAMGLQAKKPSWALFALVQSSTFRSLKFTWYPQFVKSEDYDIMLRSATMATKGPSPEDCLQKFLGVSYGEDSSGADIERCMNNVQYTRRTLFGRHFTGTSEKQNGFLSKLSMVFRRGKSAIEDDAIVEDNDTEDKKEDSICIATPWRRGQSSEPKRSQKNKFVSSFATGGSTPFDEWITRDWWDQIETSDMDSWRRVNSGEFEAGLRKMMPIWMPVDRGAVSLLLNSLHIETIDKHLDVWTEQNEILTNLLIINKVGNLTPDLVQNQYDKMRETYPYSDAAARIYPNDVVVLKNLISSIPMTLFSRTTQIISFLSTSYNIRGVVVFYCNMICHSHRVRSNGYTGSTNQYSIEPTEENEKALPHYAAARRQYMEMFDLVHTESQSDVSIQSPIYTEKYASEYCNTFHREGGNRVGILTETREKEGLLYLLDTSSARPMSCVINLSTLSKVSPAQKTFSTVDLYDGAGLIWQLHPIGVDEDDANASTKNLLQYVSMYMNKAASITRVIKQGFLLKRGYLNTSWQSRWCILSSDMKLRYYKYENGQYQGTIDIATISNIQYHEGKDTTFILLAMERNWVLQAPTSAEKKNNEKTGWIDVMNSMLEEIGSVNVCEVIGSDPDRPSLLKD